MLLIITRPAAMTTGPNSFFISCSLSLNDWRAPALESMIRRKPAPDLIRGGDRFAEKIMRPNKVRAGSIRSEA
ncbi:MAG TPA: hypothetical protein VHN20_15480, partial [Beijerinckiaceae bacterium]|nr:hypothetical protein [Beijerinckiaceae bacterium]